MASFQLSGVSLSYRIAGRTDSSKKKPILRAVGGSIRNAGLHMVEISALNQVDLVATDGDRIGLIGPNGAGKTSLLKVVAGIYRPQRGRIKRVGRAVSIINPGAGLEPALTGYENIETIGLLSGMNRRAVANMVPDIEAFTELGGYLSLPISTYSAGMQTRLAFAIATAMDPDILIVDEHLSTGDARFIEKAKARMAQIIGKADILLLASHSLETIRTICNRAILLDHGQVVADGKVEEVAERYAMLSGAEHQAS